MHLVILYSFLLCFTYTKADDESVLSFKPSSFSVTINAKQAVDVQLLKTNVTFPVTISFLYDDHGNNTAKYIDTIPDIIFKTPTKDEKPMETIYVIGRREGHLILTAISSEVNISTLVDYVLIDVGLSKTLDILIQVVGWIYFAAWSISFYPQIILNFTRKSVVGLNFDFLALNILGHSCYSVFNLSLYISKVVQNEYYARHQHGVLPVLLNDVIFSVHAVFACIVTVIQCLMYERKNQRVSYIARAIASVLILFLIVSSIVCIAGPLKTLDLLYYFSYVKLSITIMKYCPQAFMNYKRKSTEGWSIGNILLDFTGGVLSFIQMFLLAKNYNDWSSIFGSPTKLGLALFSIFFDVIFMAQHYICYRHSKNDRFSESDEIINEHSPILAFKK